MPFTCDKHGFILYGDSCLNCERERAPITPKITPPTPRFSPRIFDSFRCDGADAMAMAITPRFSTKLLAQTAQPMSAKMEVLVKKLSERMQQEADKSLMGALYFGSTPTTGAQTPPEDFSLDETMFSPPRRQPIKYLAWDYARPSLIMGSVVRLKVET